MAHGQSYMAEPLDTTSGSQWQLERAARVFLLEGRPLAHILRSTAVPSQPPCLAQKPCSSSFPPSLLAQTFCLQRRLRGTPFIKIIQKLLCAPWALPFCQAAPKSMCWPAGCIQGERRMHLAQVVRAGSQVSNCAGQSLVSFTLPVTW